MIDTQTIKTGQHYPGMLDTETVEEFLARGGKIRVYNPKGEFVGVKTRIDDYRTWEEMEAANADILAMLRES